MCIFHMHACACTVHAMYMRMYCTCNVHACVLARDTMTATLNRNYDKGCISIHECPYECIMHKTIEIIQSHCSPTLISSSGSVTSLPLPVLTLDHSPSKSLPLPHLQIQICRDHQLLKSKAEVFLRCSNLQNVRPLI